MDVEYDGAKYTFDLDDITVQQAKNIHSAFGLTLMGLEQGLNDGHPDALTAIYWLMMAQSGQTANIKTLDFKIVKFAQALEKATEAEAAVTSAAANKPKSRASTPENPTIPA